MKIQGSSTAVSDLESIRQYIARDSPGAARKVAQRIKEVINRLNDFPLSGRVGRVSETRELVIPETSYIAAYVIRGDEVLIAAVLHGRRNWPESFEGPAVTPQ
jgi:addiction module RelE/StbE family toxin